MSDQDSVFKVVLDVVASDLELLELSINDINIALGGSPVLIPDSYVKTVRSGGLYECFTRSARNARIFKCYQRFKGLDLQVDSFFRILKLHLNRGFSFLTLFHQSHQSNTVHKVDHTLHNVNQSNNHSVNHLVNGNYRVYNSVKNAHNNSFNLKNSLNENNSVNNSVNNLVNENNSVNNSVSGNNSVNNLLVKLFCLCYVDVIFDLYYGVLKQVVNMTIHDCVYVLKFFSRLDSTLSKHRIKHVYIRDEIYDLILHSLWFALKDAWWLYMDPKFIKPLFPFIAHMRVSKHYEVTVHDLNHVLHNLHFVTLISQNITYQSDTPTVDPTDPVDTVDPAVVVDPVDPAIVNSNSVDKKELEYDLKIEYVRSVETFGIASEGVEKTGSVAAEVEKLDSVNPVDTVEPPESLDWINITQTSQANDLSDCNQLVDTNQLSGCDQLGECKNLGDVEFAKYQFDTDDIDDFTNDNFLNSFPNDDFPGDNFPNNFPNDNFLNNNLNNELIDEWNDLDEYRFESDVAIEPSWSQVIYIVLVGFIYIVLFESYFKEVSKSLNTKMNSSSYVNFLIKRLEDVIQVTGLIVEVDCNFTAWARDKLGDSSDQYLATCFNTYSDDMFSYNYTHKYNNLYTHHTQDPHNTQYTQDPLYKMDDNVTNPYISFNSRDKLNLYMLSLSYERAQKLQYELVRRVSMVCSSPTLRYIDNLYFISESGLYREILYNPEKFLIGPNGPLSKSCKHLSLRYKRAIFVETFFKIVSKYVTKVTDYESEPCEAVFFDSMSLWDSVLDFFDFSANPQIIQEECVKLVSNVLDRIKFTHRVDLTELNSFKERFTKNFFTPPNSSQSLLSSYAYKCISFITSHSTKCSSHSVTGDSDMDDTCYQGDTYRDDTHYKSESDKHNDSDNEENIFDEICLDKFNVWLDGVRKKRMIVFGNVILFFRDNSLLQPVGFISFDSIYAVLGPRTMAQVHPNVHILENNSENDSFSCGTSESSEDPHPLHTENSVNITNSYTINGDMDMKALRRENGSISAKTSRRSSVYDNMSVWGWQVRLELFDSCVLQDFSNLDVVADFEFSSPENRQFWQQMIKDNPGTRPQFISWPYHTFFFDSI